MGLDDGAAWRQVLGLLVLPLLLLLLGCIIAMSVLVRRTVVCRGRRWRILFLVAGMQVWNLVLASLCMVGGG